jgi:Superinfection immunity protein
MLDPPVSDLTITLIIIATGLLAFGIFFLPALVALRRNHPNAAAILALNLLLGWTFLGWVIALVWAMCAQTQRNAHDAP